MNGVEQTQKAELRKLTGQDLATAHALSQALDVRSGLGPDWETVRIEGPVRERKFIGM